MSSYDALNAHDTACHYSRTRHRAHHISLEPPQVEQVVTSDIRRWASDAYALPTTKRDRHISGRKIPPLSAGAIYCREAFIGCAILFRPQVIMRRRMRGKFSSRASIIIASHASSPFRRGLPAPPYSSRRPRWPCYALTLSSSLHVRLRYVDRAAAAASIL